MMEKFEQGASMAVDHIRAEMLGLLGEPMAGQRWVLARQHKVWRPPTDVFETDDCIVVKVEIAGMEKEDFSIVLDAKTLIISGVRHDSSAKVGYQQMEIFYGQFETAVHLPRAVDEEGIEAIYQDGFLLVRLPKAQSRRVPVMSTEDSS
jgi:HSP20 family protein